MVRFGDIRAGIEFVKVVEEVRRVQLQRYGSFIT